jgi:hypothetical protein
MLHRQPEAAGMIHFQGGAGRKPNLTYFDDAAAATVPVRRRRGGGGGTTTTTTTTDFEQYCTRTNRCKKNAQENIPLVESTWGLASYYVKVPWHWLLYFGKSMIEVGKEGHPLRYETWTAIPPSLKNDTEAENYPNGKLVPVDLM